MNFIQVEESVDRFLAQYAGSEAFRGERNVQIMRAMIVEATDEKGERVQASLLPFREDYSEYVSDWERIITKGHAELMRRHLEKTFLEVPTPKDAASIESKLPEVPGKELDFEEAMSVCALMIAPLISRPEFKGIESVYDRLEKFFELNPPISKLRNFCMDRQEIQGSFNYNEFAQAFRRKVILYVKKA